MSRAEWRIAAEQYECETCNAAPKASCRTRKNKETVPHGDRLEKARANDWKIYDEISDLWLTPAEFRRNQESRNKRRGILGGVESTYYQNAAEREMGY
jgi:hypothetical protein